MNEFKNIFHTVLYYQSSETVEVIVAPNVLPLHLHASFIMFIDWNMSGCMK